MNKNKIVYENWTFQGNDFKDGNMFLATSLLSSQLQVNSFEATVKSADPSIINFERNSKLIYYYDNRQQGIFYVQDIERAGPDTYKISATSTLGLLTEGKHYGGIYTGQTAQEIISDICGTVPFIIKNNLAGTKLYGWLPIAAPRDNLSQVLFAVGAALKTDLDGVLRIAGLWDGVSGSVGRDEMYQGAKVEYAAKVTQVVLTEHQYSEGGDTKKLFEGTAQAGDIITFNAPMYNLSASGFSIQASGANWAKVSGGSGALTGNEYVHNTRLITRDVQTANEPNVKTVDKATLVSLVNSSAVADRLVSYFKCKETINADVVYKGENAGNVMTTYHPFDRADVNSCLQSADITLSNTMKAQEKSLVGFKPLQGYDIVTIDQHQVITDSRTIRLPEDASQLRIVLIGGGDGGNAGQRGNNGTGGSSSTAVSSSAEAKISYGVAGRGGTGGSGGSGGTGGKVFQVDIGDNISTPLVISVGNGGSSESSGNETTVTINGVTYSSASGTQSPGGYSDITTGIVYAGTGNSGLPGAAGGSGGPSASDLDGSGPSGYSGSACNGNPGGTGGPGGRSYSGSKWISIPSGGGGGGAAYNASGGTGGTGQNRNAGSGGTGATGTMPAAETRPGWGGTGGNGGGGGGGGGGTAAIAANGGSVTVYGGSAGTGGNGGPGGNGAPGCVILYYGVKFSASVEYEDRHEVITSNTTWAVPEGVNEVTVVCIGGGTGGYSGYYGSSTPVSQQAALSESGYGTSYVGYYPGEGCLGGNGGQPGGGGKVYMQTISVKAGQSFSAVIGSGGSGGSSSSSGSNAGSQGGQTSFGPVSSNSGSPSSNGYTDVVTGIKYATPGRYVGIKGGKGGTSNKVDTPSASMQPGESVTDRNGRTWSAGPIPDPSDRRRVEKGSFYASVGRGMGGGAAAGGNGGSGSYGSASASSSSASATAGTGGAGGNAAAPAKTSVRGGGGDGGNGGGGGGGPGLCGAGRYDSTSGSNLYRYRGNAGPGGAGSNGGQGGDGIIILYYRFPKITQSGQLVDKNKRMVLDRIGRRIIV